MGFQVRHREYGIFQGDAAGLAFWYDGSPDNLTEIGICEFVTENAARNFIQFCCRENSPTPFNKDDFSIEPFDIELHTQIINNSEGLVSCTYCFAKVTHIAPTADNCNCQVCENCANMFMEQHRCSVCNARIYDPEW